MYKIYADDTLIYDSTLEDYKIGKGSITLETNKSGSFTFSLYPDHFYYDGFTRLKTVITVYKSGKIVFRGRVLKDVTDYWNNKVITCEGELGFLQDSIIRPFAFTGTPKELFTKFVNEHNAQVDDFKKFKVGTVTVVDTNDYIARSNSGYESALSNLNSRLIEDSLGGYFYITHGEDGRDIIPTLNYLSDFTKVSSQTITFGSNLKDYTKTVTAESIATAIVPLGHEVDDGDENTENLKLTIADVNGGKDYVYSQAGVALYGWIYKTVSWDDVTDASTLKKKAEEYLESVIQQNITIELNAIDLHLLDPEIESFGVCDYVHVISAPHNFDATLLCNKQTLDLLKPDNDTVILGYTYSSFTEKSSKAFNSNNNIVKLQTTVNNISNRIVALNRTVTNTEQKADNALGTSETVSNNMSTVSGNVDALSQVVMKNTADIETNTEEIEALREDIENIGGGASDEELLALKSDVEDLQNPTFTQASSRENIASGEAITTIFGKIAKWFADLKTVAFTGSYKDLSDTPSKLSEFENDKEFITSIPTEYVTEDELTAKGYASKTEIPTKLSELENDSGFVTSTSDDDMDIIVADTEPTEIPENTIVMVYGSTESDSELEALRLEVEQLRADLDSLSSTVGEANDLLDTV